MTKVRLMLLGALAGSMALAAGCKSLVGSACLKPPPEAEVGTQPPLRIPVGLDSLDTNAALKVPSLDQAAPALVTGRCLEDPPLIQPLADPVAESKAQKKAARKSSREARDARPPGPRFGGN